MDKPNININAAAITLADRLRPAVEIYFTNSLSCLIRSVSVSNLE